jgi:hypothetical protein
MQVAYTAQLADGRQVAARFEPRLYWINPGSGNWSTAANWSLNIEPSNPYDVVIGAENPLTVTGPAVNRTVKSILLAGHSAASARLHLTSGVTLTATNGASILANGILSGDGTLAGDVTNAGTITPGNALGAGAIHVAGNFSQDAAGTLSIAIGSPTVVPKLDVTGDIALGGKLIAGFVDHDGDGNIYDPVLGDSFDVLDWSGTLGGAFNSLQLPALDPDLMWNVSQLHTTGVFSVALAGDFNLDGAVDAADYVYWRKTGGPLSDYITWRTNFGRSFSGGGSNANSPAAPEPVAVVLLSIAAALGTAVRRTGK